MGIIWGSLCIFTMVVQIQPLSSKHSHYISLRLFWQVGIVCDLILARGETLTVEGGDRTMAIQVPGEQLATTVRKNNHDRRWPMNYNEQWGWDNYGKTETGGIQMKNRDIYHFDIIWKFRGTEKKLIYNIHPIRVRRIFFIKLP